MFLRGWRRMRLRIESSQVFPKSAYKKQAPQSAWHEVLTSRTDRSTIAHYKPPNTPTAGQIAKAKASVKRLPLHEILRSREDIGVLQAGSKKDPESESAKLYALVRQREGALQQVRTVKPGEKVALPEEIQNSSLPADVDLRRMVSEWNKQA